MMQYHIPNPISVAVANAGTAVQVSVTDRIVRSFMCKSRTGGDICYLGDSAVSATDGFQIPADRTVEFPGPINLADLWVDVQTNGDILDIWPVE